MGKGKGAKYANGNYKKQQKAYNDTKKGRSLIVNANKLRRQLQKLLGLTKNPAGKDAAHYKGSKTKGRFQSSKVNRRSRLKINKKK